MNLEQTFYIIAIIYMVSWLLVLLALLILTFIIALRIKRVKKEIDVKVDSITQTANSLKVLPWKGIISVIGIIPVIGRVMKLLRNSDNNQS